ncbi:MAG: HAMP domain-containing sensor histidine kinase [Candidatus Amesbacteria bacterium]|nr:HAMP domain-containing sensor histidine kinase [Candidatus Amesbacteria bacterium]
MAWATKYKSLRFRLTFWNILAFLVVTFLTFFGFYIVTGKILSIHTDNLLKSHSVGVVNLITGNNIGMHSMLTREAFNREFAEIPGMLVVAMDNKGQIFNASVTLSKDATAFGDLFAKIYKERKPFFANKNIGGSQMRFLATPIIDGENLQGVILVAHPIDVISKSLESLIIVLGVTFIILIIPVSFGGYVLIKKAIEPIATMSAQLKKIGSQNLDERITNFGAGDELDELAQTFNLLLDRLHLAFTRERQFIGDVAHELKTPLSTIRTNAEITLSKPRTTTEYQKSLEEVLVDNNKLAATLKNVLDLAWAESQIKDSNKTINLSELIIDICDIALKLAMPKNISIKSRIAPEIFVNGKSDKLGQAILNLIDNAIKFTKNGGTIYLNLSTHNNQAVIQIKDNGMGIGEPDLSHIFERFYRGSKSKEILGSGLGLAITASIIHAHHGEIKVESKGGQGSKFLIYLPLMNKIK